MTFRRGRPNLALSPKNTGLMFLMSAYEDTGLTSKVELLKHLASTKLSNYGFVEKYVNELVIVALKVHCSALNVWSGS